MKTQIRRYGRSFAIVLMLMVGAINVVLRAVERRFSAWKHG